MGNKIRYWSGYAPVYCGYCPDFRPLEENTELLKDEIIELESRIIELELSQELKIMPSNKKIVKPPF